MAKIKAIIATSFVVLVFFVVLVMALNTKTLVFQDVVAVCYDFDGGVNETIPSSMFYDDDNTPDWGYLNDACVNGTSNNLTEYACLNSTMRQTWRVVCMNGCVNATCRP